MASSAPVNSPPPSNAFSQQPGTATMKAYRLLTGKDDAAFCHRVTAALNSGWQLYGPPTVTYDPEKGHVVCGQAVTKEVADKTYHPDLKLGDL